MNLKLIFQKFVLIGIILNLCDVVELSYFFYEKKLFVRDRVNLKNTFKSHSLPGKSILEGLDKVH